MFLIKGEFKKLDMKLGVCGKPHCGAQLICDNENPEMSAVGEKHQPRRKNYFNGLSYVSPLFKSRMPLVVLNCVLTKESFS